MRLLKQSTAVKVPVGPLVDATDGTTLETGITFGSSDMCIIKHDATAVVDVSGNTISSHLGAGLYNLSLTASNTDTLGLLSVIAYDTAARPHRTDYMVVPAQVYNSLISGSDLLDVNASQIDGNATSGMLSGTTALNADIVKVSGNSTAADNLEAGGKSLVESTCTTGSTTTSIATNLTEATNDHYNGRTITFFSGALAGQSQTISDYNGTTKVITVAGFTEAPASTDAFIIS